MAIDQDILDSRCERMRDIIYSCYLDYSIMEFYSRQDENVQAEQSKHPILHHIIDLLKRDICLSLWKICYDKDVNSTTLQNLNTYLRKCGIQTLWSKDHIYSSLEVEITEARNKYVAHADLNKAENSISMQDMRNLLEYVRKSYNTLCISVVGSSGLTITDQEIALLDLKTVLSVTALLHSNSGGNENAESKKGS